MVAVNLPNEKALPSFVPIPKTLVRLKITRETDVTAGKKFVHVYRDYWQLGKMELCFLAGDGEYSQWLAVADSELAAQGEWLCFGFDDTAPRLSSSAYVAFTTAGTYTFDIGSDTAGLPDFAGSAQFEGVAPDWLTTVDDVPASTEVRILYRPTAGEPGDGMVVATTTSAADGTWLISGLNPALKYDVVARGVGCNDTIVSDVSPVVPAP